MKQFYVYTHEDLEGRVFYVGKGYGRRANDLKNRHNYHLHKIRELGEGRVVVRIYPTHDERHAWAVEIQLIACMRRAGYKLCNIAMGGDGASGYRRSDEHRRKLSQTLMGHPVSEEARRKMSAARRGTKTPERTKQKLRSKKLSAEHRAALLKSITGRKTSDETREKMRAAQLGKKASPETREAMRQAQLGKKHLPEHTAKRKASAAATRAAKKGRVDA